MTPSQSTSGRPVHQRAFVALAVAAALIALALLLGPCASLLSSRSQSAVPGSRVLILAPDAFSLRGTAVGTLQPGLSTAVDVRIGNPLDFTLEVLGVSMSVDAVHAPAADAAHPCTVGDFSVVQYSGPRPLTVAGGAERTLTALGVPPAQWPHVAMTNRPVNQDGCKRATLVLGFTGTSIRALY